MATRTVTGRRPGLALLEALATPHGIDRYLELLHPMLTVHELRAEVTAVHRSTADTVTLELRPNRRLRGFTAGQHVRVGVDVDGVRRTRCYSPCNSQYRADGRIELTVKAHPEGLVSRHLHAAVRPGTVLALSPAEGGFGLPTPRPPRILLLSGGSGITPVLSMLRTLCDENYDGEVVFLHYADTEADVPHLAELRALAEANPAVRLVLAYTAQPEGGDLHGFCSARHLAEAAPWYARAQTYLCGPPGLMAGVRELYDEAGISARLHTEDFAPAPLTVPVGEVSGAVEFTHSGLRADNSGATLLEQAEAAGLNPEHGCRMGICFSCTRRKSTGRVLDVRSGDTSAEEDEEIQLCVSVPVGDVAVDL